MTIRIASLVSIGRHPVSGRERRAPSDARAVELALALSQQTTNTKGKKLAKIHFDAIHAGRTDSSALRSYLGMGLPNIQVLDVPENIDVTPVLAEHLQQQNYDLILTGMASERGESSGLLPYLLTEKLGYAIVSNVVEIELQMGGKAKVLQALPRGQRRALEVSLPAVLMVDMAAVEPRQSAVGVARRGEITPLAVTHYKEQTAYAQEWLVEPARQRPKRLKVIKAKTTAADRFKAATAVQGGGGKVVQGVSAQEGAKTIMAYLSEEGVV